jgi:hypothetical protein
VTIEEIRATIEKSLPLRIPLFDPDTHPRVKMTALEDYILRTAHMRGELEEALHWAIEIGKQLRLDWDNHYGHQALLTSKATQAQVIDAKRRTGAGPVWDGMQEAKALVESLERQIRRLGGSDYDAASRAYTLMSGS